MNMKKDQNKLEVEALEIRQHQDTIELARAHIDQKNKFRNLTRCMNKLRIEGEEDQLVARANEPVELHKAEIEQEECLAIELDKVKCNEFKEKLLRQQLRDSSQELRELESKLRAAYASKQLVAQIAEKKAMKMQQKVKNKEINELLEEVRIKDVEYRTMCKQKEIDEKEKYKQELHDQMILQEKNKRFQYEEFLREKKMLDDIVQRINDEDVRAMEERMCKMKRTRQEIEAFKAAQMIWKQKQKEALVEENRQIQAFLLSKASQAKARKEEKEKQEACKARICDQIAKQMYDLQKIRRDREEITSQLLEEEMKEDIQRRHQMEVEKEFRTRVEMLTSLQNQMEEHKQQSRKQAEEDALYKEQLIAKIAEDEKLEQLSNEKKRRKLIEVRKTVEEMIMQRRQQKAEEMQRQISIFEAEEKAAEERRRLIQEERLRLLQEHAHNLIGYLPRGVLQPDDLPYLQSDIVKTYGGKYKTNQENI